MIVAFSIELIINTILNSLANFMKLIAGSTINIV